MKKYQVLMSLLCVAIFVFLAVGSTGNDDEPKAVQEAVPDEPTEVSEDLLIDSMLDILESSFENNAKVHVDKANKMFILTPTDPDLIESFDYVVAGHEEMTQLYRDNVESQKTLSITIAEILPEYSLAIANPHDPDLLWLVTWNGIVIYDFTDDLP
jgi:hypothetical protein